MGELEDWLVEHASDDWPFEQWRVGPMQLRPDFNYFEPRRYSAGLGPLLYPARQIFKTEDHKRLQAALDACAQVVLFAIEHSSIDAYENWLKHEVWFSVLDDTLTGDDDPAQLVAESISYVGTGDDFTSSELLAAVTIWAIAEYEIAKQSSNDTVQLWALRQAAIALSHAQFDAGEQRANAANRRELTIRNRKAAEISHRHNRENKEKGRAIWASKEWKPQADAERAIARECNVVQAVAAKWIREFKRLSE